MNHAIARRFLLLCIATAALMLNLAGPANAVEPTALTAALKAEAGGLTVSGTLTTNGSPVTGATVDVALDSTPTTSATTDDAGAFSVAVPVADLAVAHALQISFAGTEELNPATAEARFTPAPVETRAATAVNASVADDTLYPGELITISGSLEAAGAPVPSGEINVYLSGQELGDSLTYTGDNGSFTTYAEVPADMAPGEAALRIVHPDSTTTLTSERTVTLAIQESAPEATEPPTQEPPTTSETTPATQPPTTEAAEPAASTEPTALQTAEPTDAETSPFNWFWVGALVAGGSAALVTIALLMSRAANREEKREREEGVEPLYLLGDDEDVAYEPENHGWVTEEFFLPDYDLPDEATPREPATEPHAEHEGETTQPFRAPEAPIRQAPEPGPDPEPELYRSAEEPIEQPKPRRSWVGEE